MYAYDSEDYYDLYSKEKEKNIKLSEINKRLRKELEEVKIGRDYYVARWNRRPQASAAEAVAWRMWEPTDGGWWKTTSSAPDAQYHREAGFTVEPLYAALLVQPTPAEAVSQDAGELIAHGKLAADILEQVRAGKIDLRPVGELLTGKWDQDVPAGILRAAVVAASADEQVSTLAAREAASARMREALKPFANVANSYDDAIDPDDRPVGPFTLGSCRDAKAALAIQSPSEPI